MSLITSPTFLLVLFIFVRSLDLAITSAMGHSLIRAIAYGLVALLAIIALIVLLGLR